MTHHWDELSKSLAEESLPRRELLRRLGFALAGAVLSPLGLKTASAGPHQSDPCKAFCKCRNKKQQNQCLAACNACGKDPSRLSGSCGNYFCCSAGQASCSNYCADLANDPNNCGACGNACHQPGPNEYGACIDGECRYACVQGAVDCNGGCTFIEWDPNNCGACGNLCPESSPYCNFGVCSDCPPGLTLCGGNCVDLSRDPGNCGTCGNVCAADESCVYGACAPSGGEDCTPDSPYWPNCCPGGWTICGGACVYTYSDPYNCGACGNVCEPGFVCSSGACWDPACQFNEC